MATRDISKREYGVRVLRGLVGDVPLEPASRDLITIWHVLEHTEDSRAALKHLRKVLAPSGLLVGGPELRVDVPITAPHLPRRATSPL